MVNGMEAARSAARRALEAMYEGKCTVIGYLDSTDDNMLTTEKEVILLEDQPCRLSYEKIPASDSTDTASGASQGIRLFLAPEVRVDGGSKVIVTQNGQTEEYSASGEPAVYATHQEIMLELSRRWT